MDKFNKLMALALVCLSVSLGWMGYVAATPAPSRNTIVEPGWSQACTDYIYLDGTTPVDHSGKGVANIVGTAGQDIAAFLTPLIALARTYCFEPGTYLFSSPLVITFAGQDPIMPSLIGPAVGSGSGTEISGTSAVVFQASNTFPSGEYLVAYLPDASNHEIKGAAFQNFEIMCKSPDT